MTSASMSFLLTQANLEVSDHLPEPGLSPEVRIAAPLSIELRAVGDRLDSSPSDPARSLLLYCILWMTLEALSAAPRHPFP